MAEASEPLTEADVQRCFDLTVPQWFIERLDTQLGTAQVVKLMDVGVYGIVTHENGLPYGRATREQPTYAFCVDRSRRRSGGFDVRVVKHTVDGDVLLRAGNVAWNRLANMATFAALEHHRQAHPATELEDREPGTQGMLF